MKKLKRLALTASMLSVLLCAGCTGYSQATCYEGVKAKYPDSNVIIIPGQKYRFLVDRPNGDVLYVETMNISNGDVTTEFTAISNRT